MYKQTQKTPTTKITKIKKTKDGMWAIEKEGKKTYWSGKMTIDEVKKAYLNDNKKSVSVW